MQLCSVAVMHKRVWVEISMCASHTLIYIYNEWYKLPDMYLYWWYKPLKFQMHLLSTALTHPFLIIRD